MLIYISSGPDFHRDSESARWETQNSTHGITYDYICVLAIFPRKFDLHQSWWSIYHLDWNFTEIPNLKSETPNSTHGISYIVISVCFGPISGEIGPPPIMLIYISSGPDFHRDSESEVRKSIFHPWHLMWPYLCFSHIGPPPVMMICISSGSDVHRDSESEVRSSKFHQSNPHLTYLCSTYL